MPSPADQPLPHSEEAERAVLGSMLLEWDAVIWAQENLGAGDFYAPVHEAIYRAILAVHEEGSRADLVTVSDALAAKGQLDRVGGTTYLTTLQAAAPTAAGIAEYGRIVRDKARLRQGLVLAERCVTDLYGAGDAPADDLLRRMGEEWTALGQQGLGAHRWRRVDEAVKEAWADMETRAESREADTIPTGLHDLDREIGGLQRKCLYVLAGRPRDGKTAMALNWLCHIGGLGLSAAMFSLEMSMTNLAGRVLASLGGVSSTGLRMARLDETDWQRAALAADSASKVRLWVDDTRKLDLSALIRRARIAVHSLEARVLAVDYLQLIHVPRAESVRLAVMETMHTLQALAGELDVPIIVVSQVGRAAEAREDKRPTLADLKESGAIEEDADVVLFIHHPRGNHGPGVKQIVVAKNRHGPTGRVIPVYWHPDWVKFSNASDKEVQADAH